VTSRGARIGWIPSSTDPRVASTRLRCALPCRYLREAGLRAEILDRREPYNYDLVVFQKIYDEDAIQLAFSLRRRGTVTVFDLCDNHFYNPDDLPALTERAERLQRMLAAVDAVSVSTEPLRELLSDRDPTVIDDALDELQAGRTREIVDRLRDRFRTRAGSLRVVWYGNAGLESPPFGLVHLPKILPILEDLHRLVQLELTVISNSREKYAKALDGAGFPSRYFEWDLKSFPRLFRGHDICVIPIELNPFTAGKTGNRVALSLLLGVPVVADPIPSFEEFSDFILLDDWPQSLRSYATDPALVEEHLSAGRRYVEATYTKERVVQQWSEFFERLVPIGARTQPATREVSKAH
jgi:glycosyltransferase involved in cell wall biosynthesis